MCQDGLLRAIWDACYAPNQQDQPINGPMCDGDAIREECPEIYTSLSVGRSTSPGANAAHKHF